MTHPGDLFARLDEGFPSRCGHFDLQRAAWEEFAREYPPFLERYRETGGTTPPGSVARRAGDLGLAMLWIVQATIIRALLGSLRLAGDADRIGALLDMLGHDRIASLAHSEDPANPVIAQTLETTERFVSGTKKYITGGFLSDLIILTMRGAGEEKVSRAAVVPVYILPDDAMEELSMEALRSMSHARLVLRNFNIPETDFLEIPGADLRRAIRTWGMVERALILESFIGFCIYMGEQLPAGAVPDGDLESLNALLHAQSAAAWAMYDQARSGQRIADSSVDFATVLAHAGSIRDALKSGHSSMAPGMEARLKDLDLFSHMRV